MIEALPIQSTGDSRHYCIPSACKSLSLKILIFTLCTTLLLPIGYWQLCGFHQEGNIEGLAYDK